MFETETCSRCGGSGHYSYCSMYGTTCFRCEGRRETLTKRGQEAKKYCEALRSKPARDLKVGDLIRYKGMGKTVTTTIQAIRPYDNSQNKSYINGILQENRPDLLQIETTYVTLSGIAPEEMIRMAQSKEQKEDTLQQALRYQATLNKQGKPKKKEEERELDPDEQDHLWYENYLDRLAHRSQRQLQS